MRNTDSLVGTTRLPVVPPGADDRLLAVLAHILTLVSSIVAPLVIYLVKKDSSPFVAEHAKASLNFQLSLLVYSAICSILVLVLIGVLLLYLLGIAALVLVIYATIQANDGKLYEYPFTIRFIR